MATLLLRLAGPLQSWGAEANFETRRTLGFPTKSGVVGLLAAALGYPRDASLNRLSSMRFGVRVEREGELLRDFHTIHGSKKKDAWITERFYLMDAVFLAGFESSDIAFLKELEYALRHPVYPLYLGRRSCPPDMPLVLGVRSDDLFTALSSEPWHVSEWRKKSKDKRLLIVDDPGSKTVLRDHPVSFSRQRRTFSFRPYTTHHDAWGSL